MDLVVDFGAVSRSRIQPADIRFEEECPFVCASVDLDHPVFLYRSFSPSCNATLDLDSISRLLVGRLRILNDQVPQKSQKGHHNHGITLPSSQDFTIDPPERLQR
ncbi:hypothetical protein KM043_017740 [Ampulex compressa]|nr:hypothetical protein KM043_017740 [Ampulex compressa]